MDADTPQVEAEEAAEPLTVAPPLEAGLAETTPVLDEPAREHECLRCEYKWKPRKAVSKKCPHCQSPLWNKKKTRYTRKPVGIAQAAERLPIERQEGGSTPATRRHA